MEIWLQTRGTRSPIFLGKALNGTHVGRIHRRQDCQLDLVLAANRGDLYTARERIIRSDSAPKDKDVRRRCNQTQEIFNPTYTTASTAHARTVAAVAESSKLFPFCMVKIEELFFLPVVKQVKPGWRLVRAVEFRTDRSSLQDVPDR